MSPKFQTSLGRIVKPHVSKIPFQDCVCLCVCLPACLSLCACVCVSMCCKCLCTHRGQEGVWDPLGLELQVVVSKPNVGIRSQVLVLWKSMEWSQRPAISLHSHQQVDIKLFQRQEGGLGPGYEGGKCKGHFQEKIIRAWIIRGYPQRGRNKQNNWPVMSSTRTWELLWVCLKRSLSLLCYRPIESQPQAQSLGYFSTQDSQGFSHLQGRGQHYQVVGVATQVYSDLFGTCLSPHGLGSLKFFQMVVIDLSICRYPLYVEEQEVLRPAELQALASQSVNATSGFYVYVL